MKYIPSLEEINSEWFTAILKKAGLNVTINNYSYETIGTGQIGKCVRFSLETSETGEDIPKTLIGKFPSENPGSRRTGVELEQYLREIVFYRDLKPSLKISTPKCFYADIAEDNEKFVLILEDMQPAKQGDQLIGCSAKVVKNAVLELVGLHAPSWCNDELLTKHPEVMQKTETLEKTKELYDNLLDEFIASFGGYLSDEQIAVFKRVSESSEPSFSVSRRVYSLIHVDYRVDNILMVPGDEDARLSVVDWQTVTTGNPLSDVAYVIASSLSVEDRRRYEEEIVKAYYNKIIDNGVKDFSWQHCWEEYRRGVFSGFSVTVIASMLVEKTSRGNKMFALMADRFSQQAVDLKSSELLN